MVSCILVVVPPSINHDELDMGNIGRNILLPREILAKILARIERHCDSLNTELQSLLYGKYRMSSTIDSPMHSTINDCY